MSRQRSLAGRLSRLKKDGLAPPVKSKHEDSSSPGKPRMAALPGWVEIAPSVWRRSVLLDNPLQRHYENSLLLPPGQAVEDLIFYDTETTGLSTGAGTIPFLIGLGRISSGRFEVIQYFLADYPGEYALLMALKSDFPGMSVCVSYNGKSYDSHLINTRFLMNGISRSSGYEVDLLYICRRLWKNSLENCRLGTIEERVLSITRGPDIPGSEIPDVWFDFLKTGNTEKLRLVFSHNLQDIHSLASLLHKVEMITAGREGKGEYTGWDPFALAKMLLQYGRAEGMDMLEKAFADGSRDAGSYLSLLYKRAGRWDRAVSIWRKLNRSGCHLFSVEELAKYFEHRTGDFDEALSVVNNMLKGPVPLSEEIRERLMHRKKRLLKKKGEA